MATLISRLSDLATAIAAKFNGIAPRLLPASGSTGQVLTKASAADYASAWAYGGQHAAPTTRTIAAGTAYQATTTAKSALVTINITSTATISLVAGQTNTADIVIGATNAVATGTGTVIGKYANSNTGTLTIGLNLATISAVPFSFALPAGWYFAVRQTGGTIAITSAFDQAIG